MKKGLRILSFMLAVLMLCLTFVSCDGSNVNNNYYFPVDDNSGENDDIVENQEKEKSPQII